MAAVWFLTDNDWWIGPDSFADKKQWMDTYLHAPYGFTA